MMRFSPGHFHSKAYRANLLTDRLDAPKLYTPIQNDNQANIEWIAQRTVVLVKTFNLDFLSQCKS